MLLFFVGSIGEEAIGLVAGCDGDPGGSEGEVRVSDGGREGGREGGEPLM